MKVLFTLAAVALALSAAIPASADENVTLTGCLIRGEGDGDPYLLANAPATPSLGGGSGAGAPSGVGTVAEFRTIFYWLDGDSELKSHVGHRVEIEGTVKGDVKDGEIELDRKENWTELQVKADGRSMKARVPNPSLFPAGKSEDRKGRVSVRRVDVDRIKMLSASCDQ